MAKAYGSITIVDIGDMGQLSVVPESNQPTMVLYDPDSGTYNPNWANQNLVLTPIVYYAGQKVTNFESIKWEKKEGSGEPTVIQGGLGPGGVLTVNTNPFSAGNVTFVTYIVTVTYLDANMRTSLTAAGQISFGLIQNAPKARSIHITGKNVFLYKTGNVIAEKQITLTATAQNVNIDRWQYKNNSGNYQDISGSKGAGSIVIKEDDAIFFNDVAVIKVLTNDSLVYDEHTITKIRDGANGSSVYSAILSNEDQMIPFSKGIGNYADANTTITIYKGNENVTAQWTINLTLTNVEGTADPFNRGYTVTKLTGDTGSVKFVCTMGEEVPIEKTFSLVKVSSGADGITPVIRSLGLSTVAINATVNEKGVINGYTPTSIVLSSYKQTGTDKQLTEGRFRVYADGSSSPAYSSTSDEKTTTWNFVNVAPKKTLLVKLYDKGSFEKLLDSQTVIITSDGVKGEQGNGGAPGKNGISFILGNYSDVIPCNNAGNIITTTNIQVPFAAYEGSSRINCTAELPTSWPSGLSGKQTKACTPAADGIVTLTFTSGLNLGNKDTGEVSITLKAKDTSFVLKYSWTKNRKAADGLDGQNAVLFQIFAPEGNVISNGETNVTLKSSLTDGSTSSNPSCTWYQYNPISQQYVSKGTGVTYIVQGKNIEGYASFKATLSYKEKSYEAFFSVYDKTDPLQITVYSTLGDKIVNSKGEGIVYAAVYRNGVELDPMRTIECSKPPLEGGKNGDFIWQLDTAGQPAILYKNTNGRWAPASKEEQNTGKYTWSFRDKNNNSSEAVVSGKAIYINSTVIETKKTFDVEVEI